MRAADLEVIFKGLATPTDASYLNAKKFGATSRYRIAKDHQGLATLLVVVGEQRSDVHPIDLEHFSYVPRAETTIKGDRSSNKFFGIITCKGDVNLRLYFFQIVAGLATELGPAPSEEDLDTAIQHLVRLFSALAGPGTRKLQGLWAELLLLANSADPDSGVLAWHSEGREIHDFCAGTVRVEVKCTSRKLREHQVSFEQLHPPAASTAMLVSYMVERSQQGTSVLDLAEELLQRLSTHELRRRAQSIIADAIGMSWRDISHATRFDRKAAEDSMRVYDVADVPSVAPGFPAEVSLVSFRVDLSGTPSLPTTDPLLAFDAMNRALDAGIPSIVASLSPMGQESYRVSWRMLQRSLAEDTPWSDMGLVSLGFFRILELELNERLIRPLSRHLDRSSFEDQLRSLLTAAEQTEQNSKTRKTAKTWQLIRDTLTPVLLGEASGMPLGTLEVLLGKARNNRGPDRELKELLALSLNKTLNPAGQTALRDGQLAALISTEKRERFRNPPAHSRFLSSQRAKECREHVEASLRDLLGWIC